MSKTLYSEVTSEDVRKEFNLDAVGPDDADHLNDVLEAYAQYRGSQLETLTHSEDPWREARAGYSSSQRCEREINEDTMRNYTQRD